MAVGQDEHDVVERCGGGEEEGGGDAYADGGYAGVPVVDLEEGYEDAENDAGEWSWLWKTKEGRERT